MLGISEKPSIELHLNTFNYNALNIGKYTSHGLEFQSITGKSHKYHLAVTIVHKDRNFIVQSACLYKCLASVEVICNTH